MTAAMRPRLRPLSYLTFHFSFLITARAREHPGRGVDPAAAVATRTVARRDCAPLPARAEVSRFVITGMSGAFRHRELAGPRQRRRRDRSPLHRTSSTSRARQRVVERWSYRRPDRPTAVAASDSVTVIPEREREASSIHAGRCVGSLPGRTRQQTASRHGDVAFHARRESDFTLVLVDGVRGTRSAGARSVPVPVHAVDRIE